MMCYVCHVGAAPSPSLPAGRALELKMTAAAPISNRCFCSSDKCAKKQTQKERKKGPTVQCSRWKGLHAATVSSTEEPGTSRLFMHLSRYPSSSRCAGDAASTPLQPNSMNSLPFPFDFLLRVKHSTKLANLACYMLLSCPAFDRRDFDYLHGPYRAPMPVNATPTQNSL